MPEVELSAVVWAVSWLIGKSVLKTLATFLADGLAMLGLRANV
jgi:hypothetical protein